MRRAGFNRGADFVNDGLKIAVDPCGASQASVNSHRKYSKGGYGVIVRTGVPTGGLKILNVNAGRLGGLAQALVSPWRRPRIARRSRETL